MDRQHQQNVNQAAQEWTEAVKNSFQTLADQTVNLQEINLKLTQIFFQQFVEQLQSKPEWPPRDEEQQLAFETLAEESAKAYTDFLNSSLSFYWQSVQGAEQVVVASSRVAQNAAAVAGRGAGRSVPTSRQAAQGDEEPNVSGYSAPEHAAAVRLIDELLSEDSSYDEETWPEIAEALDKDRLSHRKLFVD